MKNPSISLFLLFLFCAIQTSSGHPFAGDHDFISKTCMRVVQSNPDLSYNFCVTSLHSEPVSQSASLQKLGVLSVRLALVNSTNTMKFIKNLLNRTPHDHYTKQRLLQCKEVYSQAMQNLKKSINAFQVKSLEDANIWVSAAYDDALTCEQGFTERGGHASPLKQENEDLMQLCSIALSITHLMDPQ